MAMFNPDSFATITKKIALLEEYQLKMVDEFIDDLIKVNADGRTHVIQYCPKCGVKHPRTIKAGFAGSGKQLR